MADKKKTNAGAVELEEAELNKVQGGATEELFGAYNLKAVSEDETTRTLKASRDVVMKSKKILQN